MNALLGTLEQQRSSVSGVSLDEEMVNMIKFQHAYDAAAKVVTTADELFQTILNMV
jgi:flagellar hook-associated protein 1 FlgK